MNNYIEEMRQILLKEREEKGLKGIRFCSIPRKGMEAMDAQSMAQAFCFIENKKG